MFGRFVSAYAAAGYDAASTRGPWSDPRLMTAHGYAEFADQFAGASFAGGLYRVHDAHTGPQSLALVSEAFPGFSARVCPFAYDWLGRQLVLDAGRTVAGQPQVLLLEPGTGAALEIPRSFVEFHEEELVDYAEAVLATSFFEAWSALNRDAQPLQRDHCVGYKVPLFLGGQDTVENLEMIDLDVYWSICGQLRAAALRLPPGQVINEVSVHDD